MNFRRKRAFVRAFSVLGALLALASPVRALETLSFDLRGGDAKLTDLLKASSLVVAAHTEKRDGPRVLLAAALADYSRFLDTLYGEGRYSGVIHIRLDGREAAGIPLLDLPNQINKIEIAIDPGKPFRFGLAKVAPIAPGTDLPKGFGQGELAQSGLIRQAVDVGLNGWRDAGHAKPAVASQSVTADHRSQILAADVRLDPGPLVRFGDLKLTGTSDVRDDRIRKIAGFPNGRVFSPQALTLAAERLRRTGAFRSVSFSEAQTLGPGKTMDVALALVDEKPRRFGFGAEVSSLEGVTLSGFWLHRNLLGGAERLRIDGKIANIGGQTKGIDYSLGARLERPAVWGSDTNGFVVANFEHLDEPGYRSDKVNLGFGLSRVFSKALKGEVGIALSRTNIQDALGPRRLTLLSLPSNLTWDRRDDVFNPRRGFYLGAELTPFVDLTSSGKGVRLYADGRAYRGFGAKDRFVLAARMQFGSLMGAGQSSVPPDYLFFSGGSGTVRGQPYQSLGVDLGGGKIIGGRSFVGFSGEMRMDVTDQFGVVGFADTGYVGSSGVYNGRGRWQSGAGLGLRYNTPIGPVRLDVAKPVGPGAGSRFQVYIGIGQAF